MKTQLVTYAPDGTDPRRLGELGHISALRYSFTVPGGCDQLSAVLERPPRFRTPAMNPGRIVRAMRGSIAWEGRMLEPTPGDEGWEITAQGAGTYGSLFNAYYQGTWGSVNPDDAINRAITRGLDWVNPGVGTPTGMWLGQVQDPASLKIDGLLNLNCSKGGLTWQVRTGPGGNVLSVFALPTAPNRLLVTAAPVARTVGEDINYLHLRYQSAPDVGNTPATFATTTVSDAGSITAHGEMEEYEDLSSAGTMTAGNAQTVGNYILQRYQRASFSGPFTVTYGQLMNMGGQPVDLGSFYDHSMGAMVCKALLLDYGYGGEVKPGPVTFLAGAYEWDEDEGAAAVTPFNSLRADFSALADMRIGQIKPRKTVIKWVKTKRWHRGDTGHKHRRPTWHFA